MRSSPFAALHPSMPSVHIVHSSLDALQPHSSITSIPIHPFTISSTMNGENRPQVTYQRIHFPKVPIPNQNFRKLVVPYFRRKKISNLRGPKEKNCKRVVGSALHLNERFVMFISDSHLSKTCPFRLSKLLTSQGP